MIKGAIFDLDGTLLDSMVLWRNIGNAYLRSIGYEPREDLGETFKTFSLREAAEYYREAYGVGLSAEAIMQGINRMVEKFYLEEVQLKPYAESFLQKLSTRGVKLCIATATDRYLAEGALYRLGIRDLFSAIFTCTEVGHGKTSPFIFREAQKFLGTEKYETAVFEDAVYAAETARRDGFPVVAVYDASETEQAKLRAAADVFIPSFACCEAFWNFLTP